MYSLYHRNKNVKQIISQTFRLVTIVPSRKDIKQRIIFLKTIFLQRKRRCFECSILSRESHNIKRWICESIWICKNKQNMNRDEGRYKLPHVYNDLLQPRPQAPPGHQDNHLVSQNIPFGTSVSLNCCVLEMLLVNSISAGL